MSIIASIVGEVHIRVGGNTQETAYMVDSLPDGKFLEKNKEDASNPVCLLIVSSGFENEPDVLPQDQYAGDRHYARLVIHARQRLEPCQH